MKKVQYATGEYYHIYNRGVDKRLVFLDDEDKKRFLQSLEIFNSIEPVGSIYERMWDMKIGRKKLSSQLVELIAYCLNPNHFHLIAKQRHDHGVSELMRRLGGYTYYFNRKYKRSGSLFQGRYKAIRVESNQYLLHLSVYVNLNARVHRLGGSTSKSSWEEYIDKRKRGVCAKEIILGQFKDVAEYRDFAEEALQVMLEKKDIAKDLEGLFLE